MADNSIKAIRPLELPWETSDPFLFCMYHDDRYPAGNEQMGPAAPLKGRNIGQDFEGKDGWRMYHGDVVPGFPHHPHRGFETVTLVRKGFVDHTDSLGAAGRYGGGDVQWLTAGRGVVHAEMFPLLHRNQPNPLELFQIWLNLPRDQKMVEPHFSMFWRDQIPRHVSQDESGRATEVTLVAGPLGNAAPPSPPPGSWASRPDSQVAIWTLKMEPGARWILPAAAAGLNRTLFFFRGESLVVDDTPVQAGHAVTLTPDRNVPLKNGGEVAELLFLQGRPLGQPVAAHGPFVMNSPEEIQQAFAEYRRTQFGGWPWPSPGPVHASNETRFARYPGGRVERPH